jgi:hypothetical protein
MLGEKWVTRVSVSKMNGKRLKFFSSTNVCIGLDITQSGHTMDDGGKKRRKVKEMNE